MVRTKRIVWTCVSCLRTQASLRNAASKQSPSLYRSFGHATILREGERQAHNQMKEDLQNGANDEPKKGAMSRRLAEMAEETMDTGSKSDRRIMSEAGFSDELKRQLEERIAQTSFQAENQQAISQVTMPSSAGQGTREQAAAQPWSGSENLHDAALRMLDDSHKRLRAPRGAGRGPPPRINLRPAPKKKVSTADRLVNARDKTSVYALSQHDSLTEEEREKMRQDLKDRFSPGARPMPTTLQGLTSLANERIEDAIARGQFKNIQRGKGIHVERDYTANSPFLDTTEYFMNKIIQKQDIVPPWIEKQQELMKTAATFRNRLRNDWRRHAARTIASGGGTVQDHVRKARAYALAEERWNPRPLTKSETMSSIDPTGHITSVTVEERIPTRSSEIADDPVIIKITETKPEEVESLNAQAVIEAEAEAAASQQPADPSNPDTINPPSSPPTPAILPMSHPFRDPNWESIERSYHTLAVSDLNSLTRSYNLMAPKIAQKPYYNLARELNRCFADVAPTIADAILERSRKPVVKIAVAMHKEGSILERFDGGGHEVVKIRDEDGGKGYGFKQFWRDLFNKEANAKNRREVA